MDHPPKRRIVRPGKVILGGLLVAVLQAAVVVGGVVWIERLGLRAGAPTALARRRALGTAVLVLAPWVPIVTVWLHAMVLPRESRGRAWGSWFLGGLAAQLTVAGSLLALFLVRAAWGLEAGTPPPIGEGLVFFGSLALASSGLFLLLEGFLRPEASLAVILALVAFLTGSVFFADGFITGAEPEDRGSRIDLLLGANPLLAVSGPVAGIDLLRTEVLYSVSSIGPYYPYRYPEVDRSRDRYLAIFAGGLLLRVLLEAGRRRFAR